MSIREQKGLGSGRNLSFTSFFTFRDIILEFGEINSNRKVLRVPLVVKGCVAKITFFRTPLIICKNDNTSIALCCRSGPIYWRMMTTKQMGTKKAADQCSRKVMMPIKKLTPT